jgi:hypothetical protein
MENPNKDNDLYLRIASKLKDTVTELEYGSVTVKLNVRAGKTHFISFNMEQTALFPSLVENN